MSGENNQYPEIDENARRRFESDWNAGIVKDLVEYLPQESDPAYWPTLEELIYIDLEFAWKSYAGQSGEETVSISISPTTRLERHTRRFELQKQRDLFDRLFNYDRNLREETKKRHAVQRADTDYSNPAKAETAAIDPKNKTSIQRDGDLVDQLPSEFGGFELKQILGRGGMGVVFRATDSNSGRDVALKTIRTNVIQRTDASTQRIILERFENEAHAAARLDHPNIVSLYQVGQVDATPFIAMQLVDGEDLAQRIRHQVLDGKTAAKYIRDVASALSAAHAKGIIHRDLKPHNILIERETDAPKVTDFGLAKLTDENKDLTMTGELMGTPGYMSPEQARGQVVTELTDVYSLGATLYCLIGGRAPFQSADTLKTLEQIISKPPVPLMEVSPDVDRDINTICMKCLEKDPVRRYASAKELQMDLDRYLAGIPIVARPIGWFEKSYRWCKRNPLATTVVGALILLLCSVWIGWNSTTFYMGKYRDNANLSLRTLRDELYEISENKLLKVPGVKEVRRDLLIRNRAFFDEFIELNQANAEVEPDVAFAHYAIGKIDLDIESPQVALESLSVAIEKQTALLDDAPHLKDRRFELADSLNLSGQCKLLIGNTKEAKQDFDKALELRQELVKEFPDNLLYRRKLANIEMNLGNWHSESEADAKALEWFEKSEKSRQVVLDAKPDDKNLLFDVQYDAARCTYNMALSLIYLERDEKAEVVAEDGIDRFQKLHDQRPRVVEVLRDYSRCALVMSQIRELKNESPLPYLEKIVKANRRLSHLFPEENDFAANLALSLMNLGDFYLENSNGQLAKPLLIEAEAIWKPLETTEAVLKRTQTEIGLATIELQEGNSTEAAAILKNAEQRVDQVKSITERRTLLSQIRDLKAVLSNFPAKG